MHGTRKHDKKQIKNISESIKQYGWTQPLVLDKNNEIVIGHGRYFAAQVLKLAEVPCVYVDDLTPEQVKALRIADNKLNESPWDLDILKEEIDGLDFGNIELEFDLDEKPRVREDDYNPEPPAEPKAQLGDLYQLGRHRLLCGDSTILTDVEKLMGDQKADMLLTDPPYNVALGTGGAYASNPSGHDIKENGAFLLNDDMPDDEFVQFLIDALSNALMVMKPGAAFHVWHADYERYNFEKAVRGAGLMIRQTLIWVKDHFTLSRQDFQWQHEPCQPAGTMVRTPAGDVPIESLVDGDEVVSFDKYSGCVRGYRHGYKVRTANRHYVGKIYSVSAGGKTTRVTDNHQFSVKYSPESKKKYCTYLMRRGNWWRVGMTRTYDARGFGLKSRFKMENAEEAWLIEVFDKASDAQLGEQYLSTVYGIPYTHWEVERGIKSESNQRTVAQIMAFYNRLDLDLMEKNANRLLDDFGRSRRYPLITRENLSMPCSKAVTVLVNACNLIPDLMVVPVPYEKWVGDRTLEYLPIESVTMDPFDGTVYSLAVDKYEHYIADGIITHNCLYGEKPLPYPETAEVGDEYESCTYGWVKGSHYWFKNRKQTTTLYFDRPKASKEHPTMKPILLFDYEMKCNTLVGENVLDLFGGSGTTIMAAEQNGRNAFVVEFDPRFVDVIIDRWEQFTGEKAVLLSRDDNYVAEG